MLPRPWSPALLPPRLLVHLGFTPANCSVGAGNPANQCKFQRCSIRSRSRQSLKRSRRRRQRRLALSRLSLPAVGGCGYPAPSACPCCGGTTLRKIGEDVTETLELIPRQWKVIQHVREKFSCRVCEAIGQPPAPSHPIARGRAGPKLLAHILFSKYGLHLPLNRQTPFMSEKASSSTFRRSPTGSAPRQRR